MAESRAAVRYAKALLSLAIDQKVADTVNADMRLIGTTISENADLAVLLQNPVIRSSEKLAILSQIFSGLNESSKNLIHVLIENKRIALLNDVSKNTTSYLIPLRIHK